jgi:hypothetical protein
LDVNAAQGRRPNRAEQFRPQDREERRPAAPVPYFYTPESRMGSASFNISYAALVQLVKNPKFPQAIDALHELFATPHPEREAIINMTCALMDVAAEYQIPLHCTLGSEPLRSWGGGEESQTLVMNSMFDQTTRRAWTCAPLPSSTGTIWMKYPSFL